MNQALGSSTDIVFNTTEGFLTLFTSGEFNFSCTAFNLVKNINYNSTWTGVIKVSGYTEAIHGGNICCFILLGIQTFESRIHMNPMHGLRRSKYNYRQEFKTLRKYNILYVFSKFMCVFFNVFQIVTETKLTWNISQNATSIELVTIRSRL